MQLSMLVILCAAGWCCNQCCSWRQADEAPTAPRTPGGVWVCACNCQSGLCCVLQAAPGTKGVSEQQSKRVHRPLPTTATEAADTKLVEICSAAIAAFETDDLKDAAKAVGKMKPSSFEALCKIAEFSGAWGGSHNIVVQPPNTPVRTVEQLSDRKRICECFQQMLNEVQQLKVGGTCDVMSALNELEA